MKRFFGMMPSTEIKEEKQYKDNNGYKVTIQAGLHGWSIIYADSSSEFKDIDNTSKENFQIAYNIATNRLGILKELD